MPKIYSARWVLPIDSRPIESGAVAVDGSTIVSVGTRADVATQYPDTPFEDLGEAAILPGLVNSHSHLELTVMRGFLEGEESDFFAWLRKLTIARMAMSNDDLLVSATCGALEAARAGITCLGDSSSLGTQPMQALRQVGLRGIVYQESFGPDPRLAEENVEKLRIQLGGMRERETDLVFAGVSPHAPYTVSALQLELISRLAIDQDLPLMMHAAESEAEELFLREGRGPFADGLRQRGIEWQPAGISTIQYLKRHGVLDTKPLLAHCIRVAEADLETIKLSGAGIAHCPKSNAKLRHGRAPLADFLVHGIKVGLGSDSVASNNNCDLLEEARLAVLLARLDCLARRGVQGSSPTVREGVSYHADNALADALATAPSSSDGLFAATLGGARALGLGDQIGALRVGMPADITIINLANPHQQPLSDPADALVFASSGRDVILTVVAGKEIYRDGQLTTVDENDFLTRLKVVRTKLDAGQ